jgi:hypothetical protein
VRPAPRLALGITEAHAHASGARPVRVLRPARRARRQHLHAGNRGRETGSGARPIVFHGATHVLADADTRGVAPSQEIMTRTKSLIGGPAEPGYAKLGVSLHTSSLQVTVTKSRLRFGVAAIRSLHQRRWQCHSRGCCHDDADVRSIVRSSPRSPTREYVVLHSRLSCGAATTHSTLGGFPDGVFCQKKTKARECCLRDGGAEGGLLERVVEGSQQRPRGGVLREGAGPRARTERDMYVPRVAAVKDVIKRWCCRGLFSGCAPPR